ncbi:class I SAM-dependent methyltransferase [Aestuariivivens insulae]|uniref:class I SAM-dependent methyltransferase n=1 Tax=Aestuariivivens insulae TaxID=1621988 RepID=UPI001F589733|nr:class I SAM-dependent methyltransferase [Aestuariivivens insulae]
MNKSILNTEIQGFINDNLNSDITELLLKGIPFKTIDAKVIIEQIEAKKRSEKKLPTWFYGDGIYYPNKLNIEQTSSEVTAKYKSTLIEGDSIIDLTGGFGVDSFFFAKRFNKVLHCELDKDLSNIVNHNYEQLGVKNIETIAFNGIDYLETSTKHFDWIYVDPSRRHDSKGKVFFLNDCLPNIPKHLDLLFEHTKNIMIKTSPLLDLTIGINELKYVKTIHVVAVNNEVKELLWSLEHGFDKAITVETINLKKQGQDQYGFLLENENPDGTKYSIPLTYLYEPNSAILKAGGFYSISKQLNVLKLHQHSHLYTSDTRIDFPGRVFKIETVLPYNKKAFKKTGITKANVTTRNFPEPVSLIRKKLNIKDGGDDYLFFTTNLEGQKIMIRASKV